MSIILDMAPRLVWKVPLHLYWQREHWGQIFVKPQIPSGWRIDQIRWSMKILQMSLVFRTEVGKVEISPGFDKTMMQKIDTLTRKIHQLPDVLDPQLIIPHAALYSMFISSSATLCTRFFSAELLLRVSFAKMPPTSFKLNSSGLKRDALFRYSTETAPVRLLVSSEYQYCCEGLSDVTSLLRTVVRALSSRWKKWAYNFLIVGKHIVARGICTSIADHVVAPTRSSTSSQLSWTLCPQRSS